MPEIPFSTLVVVSAVAFEPLALGLFPRFRLPAVVLEILGGVALRLVLELVEPDELDLYIAVFGLTFLLFLAVALRFLKRSFPPAASGLTRATTGA